MIVTMSENPKDRLDFSMSRALGEAGAQIIVSSLVMPLILYFGGGDYRNIDGWRAMTLVIGAIIIICTLICFFGTKERMIVSNQNEDGTEMKMIEENFHTLPTPHLPTAYPCLRSWVGGDILFPSPNTFSRALLHKISPLPPVSSVFFSLLDSHRHTSYYFSH